MEVTREEALRAIDEIQGDLNHEFPKDANVDSYDPAFIYYAELFLESTKTLKDFCGQHGIAAKFIIPPDVFEPAGLRKLFRDLLRELPKISLSL